MCHDYNGQESNFHWFGTTDPSNGSGLCPHIDGYTLVCTKTASTIDGYKCDVLEGSIISATIMYH